MARRRGNKGGVLEWVTKTNMITAADHTTAANELDVIDLDLNPDEVAEIKLIETYIEFEDTSDVTATLMAHLTLGTDPSSSIATFSGTIQTQYSATVWDDIEDEEVFYLHKVRYDEELTSTGGLSTQHSYYQSQRYDFNPPLLVGRNIGMTTGVVELASGDAGDVLFAARIFFKRRKGAPAEIINLIKH